MPNKKPFTPRTLEKDEANLLDRSLDVLYKAKAEVIDYNNNESYEKISYPTIEFGAIDFSATGSATVSKAISLFEKHEKVLSCVATSGQPQIGASVTDITQNQVTIVAWAESQVSSVTNDTFKVYFQAVCSDP